MPGVFLNGVFFVSLAAFDTADLIVPAIAHALDFVSHGEADLKTQFIDYVRDKELLLVLDNFEQVLSASRLVMRFSILRRRSVCW